MRAHFPSGILVSALVVGSLALAGCASPGSASPAAGSDLVQVVASTDVYGDIAAQIGGDLVEVTSIISGATQDPHSYEASAQDQLALSNAALVIENGGGYDPFIDSMLDASGDEDVVVVNASEASGLIDGDGDGDGEAEADADSQADAHSNAEPHNENDAAHAHIEGFNEHVWYSLRGTERVAQEIAHELAEIDVENAPAYDANFTEFAAQLGALAERAAALRTHSEGQGVAITEPVPVYLLNDVGLENKTPDAFSEAIEEGTDVAPATLRDTLALFAGGSVALLAYNEQTAGSATEQVRAAAEDAGVDVVSLTETLPDGEDYLGWMSSNIDAIETALR